MVSVSPSYPRDTAVHIQPLISPSRACFVFTTNRSLALSPLADHYSLRVNTATLNHILTHMGLEEEAVYSPLTHFAESV